MPSHTPRRSISRGAAALLLLAGACGGGGGEQSLIAITTAGLPGGRVQLAFPETLLETEGELDAPTWEVVAGALPPGLTLGADGLLAGTPERSGLFAFTVRADDGVGEAEADLSIDVPQVALMSGFGPFATFATNPSIEALRPLHEQLVAGLDVRVVELPVEWDVSAALLAVELDRLAPTLVISTGVAETDAMRFETTAYNLQWGEDNAGVVRDGERNVEGAPYELPSELPITEMSEAMAAAGHEAVISNDPGSYLCNHVFYHLMVRALDDATMTAGFIHVPPAPDATYTVDDIRAAHLVGLETAAAVLATRSARRAPVATVHEAPTYVRPSARTR